MDVIEKARELGELLREDPRCRRMQAAKAANDLDAELQKLIGEFSAKKAALSDELGSGHIDREKSRQYEREMRELYAQLMNKPSMAEYNEAHKAVDELVGHINSIVQASISGEPEPESSQGGCGAGGCEGCAGCAR
ncbi:MAG: YlbF family regulator [Clostridia bacterium]|nr:YlbF family regulator [Clostridia bacterium]